MLRQKDVYGLVFLQVISVAFVAYHFVALWTSQEALSHYTTHAFGAIVIAALGVFLAFDARRLGRISLAIAIAGACLAVAGATYLRFRIDYLQTQAPFLAPVDVAFGFAFVSGCLIVGRYVWGAILPVVVGIALLYLFFGPALPFPFGHPGNDLAYNAAILGMGQTSGALKWIPLSADTLFLIMVYGAVIQELGAYRMLMEIGKAIGNHVRGGVALPAVIGSALTGTVTGVSMANVMITGTATIPAMTRSGYSKETAAAIESVASSGAQIMPPIMGLGIFILAEFVRLPYIEVAWKGLVPALIYFAAIGAAVLLITRKQGIAHKREDVNWNDVWFFGPQLFVPLLALVYMLSNRYSGIYAGSVAVALAVGLYLIMPVLVGEFGGWKERLLRVFRALAAGGIAGSQVALLVVLAGMLAQVITVTNFSELSRLVAGPLYEHFPALALIITAIFTIILGTGLPTVIAYVLGAITMVPVLQDLGYNHIAAHFFVFYFAVFANITPPVALNVLIASRIAGSSFMGTCMESLRLSVPAFILPFLFLYQPSLLEFPALSVGMAVTTFLVSTSTLAFLFGFFGYFINQLSMVNRVIFIVVAGVGVWGLVMNDHSLMSVHLGVLVLVVAFLVWQAGSRKEDAASA